jgi:putative hydrolase of HD superfamily
MSDASRDGPSVNPSALLDLLLQANQLKRVPRAGWLMRGLVDAESVSDHTFGVAFIALVLAEMAAPPVDVAKLLAIALLHDLGEAVLGDVPSPALSYFPSGAKETAEAGVLDEMVDGLPQLEHWRRWWREFADGSSVEGQLVRDADRLDMLIQAYVYERTTGNRWLEEFWECAADIAFESEAARSVFEVLLEARDRSRGGT